MLYDPDTKNFLIFLKKVLQNTKTYDIISKSRETRVLTGQKKKVATVAQSVERRIGSAEVTGPIPVSSSHIRSGNIDFTVFPLFVFHKRCRFSYCKSHLCHKIINPPIIHVPVSPALQQYQILPPKKTAGHNSVPRSW